MGAVSFIDVEPMQYDLIYYHDYHGWRDTKTDSDSAFNAFTAEEHFDMEAISFFIDADEVNFEAKVYSDFSEGVLSGLEATVSGYFEHRGFHTVDLDQTVSIQEGEDFYVFLYLDKGGQAYDRTSDVPVLLGGASKTIVPSAANAGESWYFESNEWKDFYDYDDPSGFDNTGNFCIKALGSLGTSSSVEVHNKINLMIKPNPANEYVHITSDTKLCSYSILDINGRTLMSDLMPENGAVNIADLTKGVYFIQINTDKTRIVRKIVKQ
jgi:hypothetical protein